MRKLIAIAAALGFLTATSLPVFAQDKPPAQTEQTMAKPAAPAKANMKKAKKSKKSMKKSMKKSSKKMSKSKAKAKKPAPKMDDQKKS